MKKYIIVGMLVFIPFSTNAQVSNQAGLEFLTPLVQQIFGLLQDRIEELVNRISFLESNSCQQLGSPIVSTTEEENLRKEYGLKQITLDSKIIEMRNRINVAKGNLENLGSGRTAYDQEMFTRISKDNIIQIRSIEFQKQTLYIELKQKLIEINIFD